MESVETFHNCPLVDNGIYRLTIFQKRDKKEVRATLLVQYTGRTTIKKYGEVIHVSCGFKVVISHPDFSFDVNETLKVSSDSDHVLLEKI